MADNHHAGGNDLHGGGGGGAHALTADMNLRKIVLIGVASLATFALGVVASYVILVTHEKQIAAERGIAGRGAEIGREEIGIVDQTPFSVDRRLDRWRAEHKKQLTSWGWVNRGAGIAHIPIDKAMEWVVSEPPDIPGEGVPPGGAGVPSVPPTPPTPVPMVPGGTP